MTPIKKVLIAEDDEVTRRVLSKTIEDEGLCCIVSTNGKRAIEILQDNPDISLLITDMVMPEMGGEELIQSIRDDKRLSTLPIIIISGIVSIKEIEHLLKLGGSRFLPKPIDTADLRHYLGKHI